LFYNLIDPKWKLERFVWAYSGASMKKYEILFIYFFNLKQITFSQK
jgi:hypothetical protein